MNHSNYPVFLFLGGFHYHAACLQSFGLTVSSRGKLLLISLSSAKNAGDQWPTAYSRARQIRQDRDAYSKLTSPWASIPRKSLVTWNFEPLASKATPCRDSLKFPV